jgi:hypothetical protein
MAPVVSDDKKANEATRVYLNAQACLEAFLFHVTELMPWPCGAISEEGVYNAHHKLA